MLHAVSILISIAIHASTFVTFVNGYIVTWAPVAHVPRLIALMPI